MKIAFAKRRVLLLGGLTGTMLCGSPALAQTAADQPPQAAADTAPADDESGFGDIIVTAQRRSESAQRVPLAISAISPDSLQKTGTRSFEDLAALAPSISFVSFGPAQDKLVIRGVSSGGLVEGFAQTTGVYLDEIPLSASYTSGGTDLAFFDVDHVEVLRGPQGTLYGAGAMGGAVRILTNDPKLDAFGGNVGLTLGSIRGRAAEMDATGAMNVPLVEGKLALRVAGNLISNGPFIRDPINNRKAGDVMKTVVRAKLKWEPSDAFTAVLTGVYGHTSSSGRGTVDLLADGSYPYGDLSHFTYIQEPTDSKTKIVNLNLSYKFSFATLMSSSTYLRSVTGNVRDNTLSSGVVIPLQRRLSPEIYIFGGPGNLTESYIQELRLVSSSTTPFKWTIGGYYSNDNLQANRIDQFAPGQPLSGSIPLAYFAHNRRAVYSLFAEATYDLSSNVHLTLGGRYTHVPSTLNTVIYGLAFGANYSTPATAVNATGSHSDSDFSPKAEISFTPSRNVLLYAQASRGFRPGNANVVLPPTVASLPSVQKRDGLWNYEVGAKTQWLNGRLTANAALYYIDWKDIQIQTSTAATATTIAFPYLGNAGDTHLKGAELELRGAPTRSLSFALSGSYTDARLTNSQPALSALKGDRINYVPRWSGSASVDFVRPLTSSLGFFAHADVRYSGDQTTGFRAPYRSILVPAYALVGLSAGFDLAPDARFTLFVHNLTDNRAQLYVDASSLCSTITTCGTINPAQIIKKSALVTQPRTIGVSFSKKF